MLRILVIDDEPLLRSTVVTILTRAGFGVEEAPDGAAGIAMFHKNQPDMVITDLFMPNRDGIEVVMELKRSYPHTKILAMTGGGQMQMMELASAAKSLGATHILYKPFDKESLLGAVNTVLGTLPPPKSQHGV
jgi:CheY-like chemotaxis protein